MDEQVNANNAAGAQSRAGEAGANLTVGLGGLLAPEHTGMKISAQGILGRIRDGRYYKGLNYGCGEMLRHLEEMAERFYSGDVKAVDEFLQLYCLDEHRAETPNVKLRGSRLCESRLNDGLAAIKLDAKRYQWLKSQIGLTLESDYMQWTRQDGTKFRSSHRLCGNDTGYAPYPTLDETIDAAMAANA